MSTPSPMRSRVTRLVVAGFAALGLVAGAVAAVPPAPAHAGPYSSDICIPGYVWREAVAGDHVCVRPETRSQTWSDNAQAASRRSPNGGPYGPDTCKNGFVWREAVAGDHVCVTPQTREQAKYDNSQAPLRRYATNVHPI